MPATGTTAKRQLGTNEISPTFRGAFDPDMTFFGFPFTEATATAGLGYYFVLAEHPGEPRFGLAATVEQPGPTLSDWNNLAWSQVTVINNHVSVAKPPTATGPGATWGAERRQPSLHHLSSTDADRVFGDRAPGVAVNA